MKFLVGLVLPLVLSASVTNCRSNSNKNAAVVKADSLPDTTGTRSGVLKLDPSDFSVGGITLGMDSMAVIGVLGRPDSVFEVDDRRDPGAKLVSWHYPGLKVLLGSYNSVGGVWISAAGMTTRRGLRIGDPQGRVITLYGEPLLKRGNEWQYEDPTEQYILRIAFVDGKVASMYLGGLYD